MTASATAKSPARLAFVYFMRTGIRLPEQMFVAVTAPLEAKFNPYHDPTNGQFTFGPGGTGNVRGAAGTAPATTLATIPSLAEDARFSTGPLLDGVYRPGEVPTSLLLTGAGSGSRGTGSNYGAFLDPMTLDQAFPGLASMPGGSILALPDAFLDLTGPASRMLNEITNDQFYAPYADIKRIDPSYYLDVISVPGEFQATMGDIAGLRWDQAAAIYRVQGDPGPLQVLTLQRLQEATDAAYDQALAAANGRRLPSAPTERMAIGNYVDSVVKNDLRQLLYDREIQTHETQPVRVQAREYASSGSDLTYTIPDARVGDVAFDVTLWRKTPGQRQIAGFFSSDFQPRAVVIIRPRQLGSGSSYIISRPGK